MPLIEVTPDVWVKIERTRATLTNNRNGDILTVDYEDAPAYARVLSIMKESPQYAAYLKREGLA